MVLNLLPGDLVDAILLDEESGSSPTEEDRKALAKEFNLDKPMIIRYAIWLGNMLTGDLVYLAASDSDHMTSQTLVVDGGGTLY